MKTHLHLVSLLVFLGATASYGQSDVRLTPVGEQSREDVDEQPINTSNTSFAWTWEEGTKVLVSVDVSFVEDGYGISWATDVGVPPYDYFLGGVGAWPADRGDPWQKMPQALESDGYAEFRFDTAVKKSKWMTAIARSQRDPDRWGYVLVDMESPYFYNGNGAWAYYPHFDQEPLVPYPR